MKGTTKQLGYVEVIRTSVLKVLLDYDLRSSPFLDEVDKRSMEFYYNKWIQALNNLDAYFDTAKDFIEMFKYIYKKLDVWALLHSEDSEMLFGVFTQNIYEKNR